MLQEMGMDRDACIEYLTGASGVDSDDIRLTPNYLHHHVQSSEFCLIKYVRRAILLLGDQLGHYAAA